MKRCRRPITMPLDLRWSSNLSVVLIEISGTLNAAGKNDPNSLDCEFTPMSDTLERHPIRFQRYEEKRPRWLSTKQHRSILDTVLHHCTHCLSDVLCFRARPLLTACFKFHCPIRTIRQTWTEADWRLSRASEALFTVSCYICTDTSS